MSVPLLRFVVVSAALFLCLASWAFTSPVGSSPDDDYHLASIWCERTDSRLCELSGVPGERLVSTTITNIYCFAHEKSVSASCQTNALSNAGELISTARGNFEGQYPSLFYKTMSVFASSNIVNSVMLMRLFNALLFVALGMALWVISSVKFRSRAAVIFAVTVIPFGLFLIPSTNPTSWAIIGLVLGSFALRSGLSATSWNLFTAVGIYVVCAFLVSGSRPDGAFFFGAMTILVLAFSWRSGKKISRSVIAGIAIASLVSLYYFLTSHQFVASASGGLSDFVPGQKSGSATIEGASGGIGLFAYNVIQLPEYFAGMFGLTPLGWTDTEMPSGVWLVVSLVVGFLAFATLGWLNRRSQIVTLSALGMVSVVALYMFQTSDARVGAVVQPRYLLPITIVILLLASLELPDGTERRVSRLQYILVWLALTSASAIAIFVNVSRYLQGQSVSFTPNLDSLVIGASTWWFAPFGPTIGIVVGATGYSVFLLSALLNLRAMSKASARSVVRQNQTR